MKILVTGSRGFIGKNFISALSEVEDVEVIGYDIENKFNEIESNINDFDFIFHLAGVNRPENTEEFYKGNRDLTGSIISLLKEKKLNTPIVITSSIQAIKDNDYGKSKKEAEDIALEYKHSYVYRLHNVFGKWSRPNYNTVVATFCYNIARDIEIKIDNPDSPMELIYIDDIVKEFISLIKGNKPSTKKDSFYYIEPKYDITVGELAELIKSFKNSMESIYVPNTGDDFTKKLYSTYISFIPIENMEMSILTHVDDRGSFSELVRTNTAGQMSVSFSKPGIVRGNHYHHTKLERFIVIKGKARISFSSVVDDTYHEFEVDDKDIKIVTIPVGYTHKIENIGDDEMILVIWCNELFDEKKPDTFFKEVKEEK